MKSIDLKLHNEVLHLLDVERKRVKALADSVDELIGVAKLSSAPADVVAARIERGQAALLKAGF